MKKRSERRKHRAGSVLFFLSGRFITHWPLSCAHQQYYCAAVTMGRFRTFSEIKK